MFGLNPCFNGRCTRTTAKQTAERRFVFVLILVLMEDALVQTTIKKMKKFVVTVLILVLMEDALVRVELTTR